MTTSAIIEETIRLQHQTNIYQTISLAMILLSDVFIILCVLNIRKTIRLNREWSKMNEDWSKRLRAASAGDTRSAETNADSVQPGG